MKSFEEFTTEDLQAFLEENGFIRASKRGNEPGVVDYEKLTEIWGCKSRQARNIVAGRLPLQRSQYNLLALHSGAIEPQLVSAQKKSVCNSINDYVLNSILDFEPGDLIALINRSEEPNRPA